MPRTATQQLVDIRLGISLDHFIAERRAAGDSWRTTSDLLFERTSLRVSHETLRSWYALTDTAGAA